MMSFWSAPSPEEGKIQESVVAKTSHSSTPDYDANSPANREAGDGYQRGAIHTLPDPHCIFW